MRAKGFDSRCHDLAQVFLADALPEIQAIDNATDLLAQEIQDAAENWIETVAPIKAVIQRHRKEKQGTGGAA